jgi:hypothetical protein
MYRNVKEESTSLTIYDNVLITDIIRFDRTDVFSQRIKLPMYVKHRSVHSDNLWLAWKTFACPPAVVLLSFEVGMPTGAVKDELVGHRMKCMR